MDGNEIKYCVVNLDTLDSLKHVQIFDRLAMIPHLCLNFVHEIWRRNILSDVKNGSVIREHVESWISICFTMGLFQQLIGKFVDDTQWNLKNSLFMIDKHQKMISMCEYEVDVEGMGWCPTLMIWMTMLCGPLSQEVQSTRSSRIHPILG